MLEWTGALCIDTIGIPFGSESAIAMVFFVADESRNDAIICSTSASSCTLRDASDVNIDNDLPLLWCL